MTSQTTKLTEQRINFLSQPLQIKTKENSVGWENKFNFWKDRILDYCKKAQTISLPNIDTLRNELKLDEVEPKCIPAVLEVMFENGLITRSQEYIDDLTASISAQTTWTSWSYDKLVRSPVKWASKKIFSPMSRGQHTTFTKFIIRDLVKDVALSVLQSIVREETPIHGVIILPQDRFFKFVRETKNYDQLESEILIKFLLVERLAKEDLIDGQDVHIFSFDSNLKVGKLTSNQQSVFTLEQARNALKNKTDSLHDIIVSQDQKIREHLKQSSKVRALHALKRKKRLEKQLTQAMNSLDKIETLIDQIHSAKDNSQTLTVIQKGIKLLESINDKTNSADDVMNELEDQLERTQEVSDALARDADSDLSSVQELEAELTELLSGDLPSQPTTPPPTSNLDDLMIQLDKLAVESGEPLRKTKTINKELAS